MAGSQTDDVAAQEAAQWLARLNKPVVDSAVLSEFFSWRKHPANWQAYERAEASWRNAGALDRDPDIAGALAGVLAQPRARRFWATRLAGVAAGVALILAVGLFYLSRPLAYATRVGEQSAIRLDDGTKVKLDTDTRIEIAMSGGRRVVTLSRGQAYFDVARDPARPFVVEAGVASVHAIGTVFDVKREDKGVAVALFEGKVGVGKSGSPPSTTLAPGQMVRIDSKGAGPITRADEAALTGWTDGRIQFDKTPLAAAVAEVNRYTPTKIVLAAPELASEEVNGGFDTGDTEAFVSAVTALYPIDAQRVPGKEIRLVARR